MSCPCGSSVCDCRIECLCTEDQCQCNKCSLLPKICSRCNLPFYIIVRQRENVGCGCSCKAKNLCSIQSHPSLRNSATSNEKVVSSIRKTQCPRCSLPIIVVTKSEDYHTLDSCCCSRKNSDSNTTGTPPTEHETSNCTSDHRDISGDRQARKTSRRTRKENSMWQYKKTKGRHLTNFDEDDSDTEETLTSEEFLVDDSRNPLDNNSGSRVACTGSVTSDSNHRNSNIDSSTQSPAGFFSRAGDNSVSSSSLFANYSGLSSPSTSKDYISPPENPGFFQVSQNVRPKLPPPFPTLPRPIPGLPAFRSSSGRDSSQQMKRPWSLQPPLIDQPALARTEKIEKWFGTIQSVLTTSGELPDAETAAVLDKKDKEKIKQLTKDHSDYKSTEDYIEPFRSSKSSSRASYLKPGMNNKIPKELDVIDPTTDTERSSSLSKSRKESESD